MFFYNRTKSYAETPSFPQNLALAVLQNSCIFFFTREQSKTVVWTNAARPPDMCSCLVQIVQWNAIIWSEMLGLHADGAIVFGSVKEQKVYICKQLSPNDKTTSEPLVGGCQGYVVKK